MSRSKRGNPVVEMQLLQVLRGRGDLAATEAELKLLTGISGLSFKEAMIRLIRKGLAVKWKSETYINYIAASENAYSAYYEEPIHLDPLYAAMGHLTVNLTVKRSIPFVVLEDPDIRKPKHNRYRQQVA